MTILQLKYVIVTANSSSIREAARRLFISQPALSMTIRELEEELHFQIFERISRGIDLSPRGKEFLAYAKKAVSQYDIVVERYIFESENRRVFSVSMQHYVFAVHAFMDTVNAYLGEKYSFSVNETRTNKVMENVRDMVSEIGVLSYTAATEELICRLIKEYQLEFHPLFSRDTFIYLWKTHPLANNSELSLKDLQEYPCVLFEQDNRKEYYLNEEAFGDYNYERVIRTNDRATSVEIIAGLNGYSVGIGNISKSVALADGIRTIKLREEDTLTIGYIVRKNQQLSEIGARYIEALQRYVSECQEMPESLCDS